MALLRTATDEAGVQAALACFSQALRARPRETRPQGYAQTIAHKGHAYEKLAELGVASATASDEYFDEAASVLQNLRPGTDRASIAASLRARPPIGQIW
jgi:hypothetical protein